MNEEYLETMISTVDTYFIEHPNKKYIIISYSPLGGYSGYEISKKKCKDNGYYKTKDMFWCGNSTLDIKIYNTSKAKRRVFLKKLKKYINENDPFLWRGTLTRKEKRVLRKNGYHIQKSTSKNDDIRYVITIDKIKNKKFLPSALLNFYIDYKIAKQELRLNSDNEKVNYNYFLSILIDNINPDRIVTIAKDTKMLEETKNKLTRRGFTVSETDKYYYIEW